MNAPRQPRVRLRIDFPSGHSVGPGKVDLLEAIAAEGSLSAAARSLGLSYRRAWLLLDDLNASFSERVVATAAGGARGGGTQLTGFGRRLVKAYRALEVRTNRAVAALEPALAAGADARAATLSRHRLSRTLRQ